MNYKKWKYNKGVPILSDKEIEKYSLLFLKKYKPECLTKLPLSPIPIFEILRNLVLENKIKLSIEDLGKQDGVRVLGKTLLKENVIILDKELCETSGLNFILRRTIAHEIAHWIFHRHKKIDFEFEKGKKIQFNEIEYQITDQDKFKTIVGGIDINGFYRKSLDTPVDWAEHHAKVFAACVLIPIRLLKFAVIKIQEELELPINIGVIHVNGEYSNMREFNTIMDYLKRTFDVSKISLQYRLVNNNLLIDHRKKPEFIQESIIKFARDL